MQWWTRDIRALVVVGLLLWPRAVVEPPPPAPPPSASDGLLPTLEVALALPTVQGAFRWEAETAGLVTLLIETGLGDLRGVVPRIGSRPVSPGLAGAAPLTGARWTGTISLEGTPERLQIALELCPPETERADCVLLPAAGTQDDPALAVARVVQAASVRLGRGAVGPLRYQPRSRDRYAQLILGRSAATGYGLLPPIVPEDVGNTRRDPAARAPFIDPTMPEAWWEQARQSPDLPTAAALLARAAALEPGSALRLADEAAVRARLGDCREAWDLWEQVEAHAPREARFVLPRAEAALCAGELPAARETLERVTATGVAEVDALRVALAEAIGPGPDYDDLLARWQASAPADPEPVRRRIHLRIREGRFSEALEMTPTLRARGEAAEAQRLQLALAANLNDRDQAAQAAESQGLSDEARRLRRLPPPGDAPATERTAYGWLRLEAGAPEDALAAADEALEQAPWLPEALALRAEALTALGRTGAASEALARLHRVDPAWRSEARR